MKPSFIFALLFLFAGVVRGQAQTLTSLLKPYRGNIVYVDFWASWCGHCLDQMGDYEERLQRHFTYQPVKFVFVDMDETKDTAKATEIIRTRHIKGKQLFWDWQMEDAQVSRPPEFLPTYMLFDQNGKLMIADAKRPSDTIDLYRQIDSLLFPLLHHKN